ncbi:hypothetical protein RIR_jg38719.t1 [Rhizophagus irregularis DAOM 181602=DAOM 197198]|nr:hypothetical protein RIR_jg38719.t1 [Rhizophagus irregularis DAOM 181602=DAOM 197198]
MKTTHSTMPYHKPTGPIAGLQQKLVPASLLRCKRLCSNPRIVLYRSKNSNQPYYETAAKSWYSQAYRVSTLCPHPCIASCCSNKSTQEYKEE